MLKSQSNLAAYKVSIPTGNHAGRRPDTTDINYVMVHLAVCCDGGTTGAENLANYSTRDIGVSWHYNTDRDSIVQSLDERWMANHSRSNKFNRESLAIEMATNLASRSVWLDQNKAWYWTMVNTAKIAADLCDRHGVPARKLSQEELQRGARGVISHEMVNRNNNPFGDSRSTHTDPGEGFPWDKFQELVTMFSNQNQEVEIEEDGEETEAPAENLGWLHARIARNLDGHHTLEILAKHHGAVLSSRQTSALVSQFESKKDEDGADQALAWLNSATYASR